MVKGNQPTLQEEIETCFATPESAAEAGAMERERQEAGAVEKSHGRVERRVLESSTALAGHPDWPGLQQVCRITRRRTMNGRTSETVTYAITSLPRDLADAAQLLALNRAHWAVENSLHYVRDYSLREDQCRIRKGNSPEVVAALRNASVTCLRTLRTSYIPEAMEYCAENRDATIALVKYRRTE